MSDDSASDPFAPPAVSTEVCCIHCGETYDSWQIEWRVLKNSHGKEQGFWCCPMPGCDGMGFGFDILPTDPNYRDERGGWVYDDEDDSEDWDGEDWDDDDETIEMDVVPEAFMESQHLDEIPWDDLPPLPLREDPPGEDWPFSMN